MLMLTTAALSASTASLIWSCFFSGLAVAEVSSSNDTNALQDNTQLQIFLKTAQTGMPLLAPIKPLTAEAGLDKSAQALKDIHITGALLLTNPQTATSLTNTDIAYISCEASTYNGLIGASAVLNTAATHNPAAIVLYSTLSNHCNYTVQADGSSNYRVIYTMTSPSTSAQLENGLKSTQPSLAQAVISQDANATSSNTTNGGNSGSNNSSNNILGSPTTAVAMIILYSITGVITALFLVIIITGAVRAHRHPERYGPRSGGNGRPRQSRAKGIARAMLDTLPIVKFGEKEEAKPGRDVELGAAGQAAGEERRETDESAEGQSASRSANDGILAEGQAGTESQDDAVRSPVDQVTEVVGSSDQPNNKKEGKEKEEGHKDGALGCSICTEDFVKGEDVRVLPCDHKYHPECIDPWLLNVSGTCPLCRIDLRPAVSKDSSHSQSADAIATTTANVNALLYPPHHDTATHESSRPRVSRFLEHHLGLTPASEPEERIAALLRLRDESREERSGGVRASSSRRASRLSGLIRDPFRRRSARIDQPEGENTEGAIDATTGDGSTTTHGPDGGGGGSSSNR